VTQIYRKTSVTAVVPTIQDKVREIAGRYKVSSITTLRDHETEFDFEGPGDVASARAELAAYHRTGGDMHDVLARTSKK